MEEFIMAFQRVAAGSPAAAGQAAAAALPPVSQTVVASCSRNFRLQPVRARERRATADGVLTHAAGADAAPAAGPREATGKTTPAAACGGPPRRSRPFACGCLPAEAAQLVPASTPPEAQPGVEARHTEPAAGASEAEAFTGVQLLLMKKQSTTRRKVSGGTRCGGSAPVSPVQAASVATACPQPLPREVGSLWQEFQRLFEPAEEPAAQSEWPCVVPSEPLRALCSPEQVPSSQELEAEHQQQCALEGFG